MCKWFSIKVKNKKKMHLSMYSEKKKTQFNENIFRCNVYLRWNRKSNSIEYIHRRRTIYLFNESSPRFRVVRWYYAVGHIIENLN